MYNSLMNDVVYGCHMKQNGTLGNFSYTVASGYENRPVTYVSFWAACRFTNWLSNGQGDGDTETGSSTLYWDGIGQNTITRNCNWTWAVSSEDEWYKAAYYDPNKAGGAGYWDYPTRGNTAPGNDMADPFGNNANCYIWAGSYPLDSGKYYTTSVGQFQNSVSAYGTYDQGGNVWEWNESIMGGYRGLRGGSYAEHNWVPQSLNRSGNAYPQYNVGFRVVQVVPEPSTVLVLLGGIAGLLATRRRRG